MDEIKIEGMQELPNGMYRWVCPECGRVIKALSPKQLRHYAKVHTFSKHM